MTDSDNTHVSPGEASTAVSGGPVDIAEPHDPARYRKVIVGALTALVAYGVTELGLEWSSELEKALVALLTLVAVERTPNAT